jgi:hypothetical protein
MTTQAVIVTSNGQVLQALSYRMASSAPPQPSVPASPYPFKGGVYHVQSRLGWIDLNASEVFTVSLSPTAS